ncbi:MAG: NifB/NifX family molybdenum-iron cluster-binding protein [Deltaproteobacteria bacterium]|uniref:NifB/NifX family molybdenum-iron cluster-binding protein n=1 Tax=Candidatus Zymogenus saltonus TaxID=2844893 RepID=A0A9D8PQ18_9DELT|nr:NifB/NifX family molybdenum-iron cluster-binding protein [Candidatus Zymogenus saltonus]
MKKIVMASEDNLGLDGRLSAHFGRCPYYVVADFNDAVELSAGDVEVVENPHFNNHQPGIMPEFIQSLGADVMIAGGMGPRAIELFNGMGIEVVTGYAGKIEDILKAYLAGRVKGTVPCAHDHDDGCGE